MSNGVSKFGLDQDREPFSSWRVIIPDGVDRDVYVDRCYKTNTVAAINNNGEIYDKIKCGKLAIMAIDFPIDINDTGSELLCATLPYSGEVRVIDVYATERQYSGQKEGQYYFQKRYQDGSAGILVDGRGQIILTVFGNTNAGAITVNVGDNNREGKFEINCVGNCIVRGKRIDLNDDGEPMLLGNTTVKLLNDLLDQLSKESAGPYNLLGQQVYADLKDNLESLKSTFSFVK